MANKEEIYPEGYPRQKESFSDEQKFKFDVFEAIKEIALETTEKAFKDNGYSKKEGKAGEYGTGDSYGAGTDLNKFNIRLSSRPNTNTYFEKIIYFGGKKAITDINIGWDVKNKVIELAYKNSEFSAFRGYGSKVGAQLINDRRNFTIKSIESFKKELKELFKSFAEKEISYITSTKIGIEDKTEKSINSMVETSMKKFSLKNLMTSSNEDLSNAVDKYISEGKKSDTEDKTRMNSPEVLAANSKDKLLFDDEELEDTIKEEEGGTGMTTSGPNGSGAGAYLTKGAFKKGGDLNLQEDGSEEKEETEDEAEEKTEAPKFEKKEKTEGEEKFEKTSYAQGQKQRPSVKKSMNKGDSFWTTVELNPGSGYVPKGMEHNFVMGQHGEKTEKHTGQMSEGEKKQEASILKESLIKRKFSSINENEEKGINRRYIVTEKRSSDEQSDRWKKLSLFETYDTINHLDKLDECGCNDNHQVSMSQGEEENERDFMQRNSDVEAGGEVDGREVVIVAKPNSLSNAMFKVFKEDYLNENRAYILDLNSGNLVSNPNFRVIK